MSCSVLMPVFNTDAKYLMAAVHSLLTYQGDMEIIVVDDGSTSSSTVSCLDRLSSDEASRVRLVRLTSNDGIVNALNAAFRASKHEFICRMDADDICSADRVAAQLAYLATHTDIDVVGCNALIVNADDSAVIRTTDHPTDCGAVHFRMFFNCCLIHPTVMARRRVFETFAYSSAISLDESKQQRDEEVPRCHAEDYNL
jgi:glycosyltransferase involved in cell wall biosynthesis